MVLSRTESGITMALLMLKAIVSMTLSRTVVLTIITRRLSQKSTVIIIKNLMMMCLLKKLRTIRII
jgi:hypothetical protein